MASWMIHLRIADKLLDKLNNITTTEFIMGNIAPDSGVPNEDWSVFTPSGDISHFKDEPIDGWKNVNIDKFISAHFTKDYIKGYTKEEYSFFLGYYTHLLTDIEWVKQICLPSEERFADLCAEIGRVNFIWTLKKDWYDLDFLYLKKKPDFRAFRLYEQAKNFKNVYMNIFAEVAFENRRQYITDFYLAGREDLEREYPYLNETQTEDFVEKTVDIIMNQIQKLHT